jgi:hypothetical protein
MKSIWLVALSAALSAATVTITTDGAMARRVAGGGVHVGGHGGVHAGNINRHPGVGAHYAGYRHPGVARWHGNYAGWRGENWRRVGWGVGAAGLAIGAAASSAYNYGTYPYADTYAYDGTYAPTYYGGGFSYQGGPRSGYTRPYRNWTEF